jgi:Sugar (and other) transporter
VLAILVSENWMLTFFTVKLFPTGLELIGLYGCMLIFAVSCFKGAVFVTFVLPHTKSNRMEEIVNNLDEKRLKTGLF